MDVMDALMQPSQPQTPMQQFGGMLQGLTAPVLGQPDPRIAQQQAQMQQKMQLLHIQNAVEKQRMEKQKVQRDIGLAFLGQEGPAKQIGANILVQQYEASGGQPIPGLRESLVSSPLSQEKRKGAYLAIRANPNVSDEYLVNQLGVPRDQVSQMRLEAKSNEVYRLFGQRTPEEEARLTRKEHLDQLKYDELVRRGDQMDARLAFNDAKEERQKAEAETRLRQADQRLAEIHYRTTLMEKNLALKETNAPETRRQKSLEIFETFPNRAEALARWMDTEGMLPKDASLYEKTRALGVRKVLKPNHDAWRQWQALEADIQGFSRTVLNDIGARAYQIFKSQFELFKDPPPISTISKQMAFWRKQLEIARTGKPGTPETVILRGPKGQVYKTTYRAGVDTIPPDYDVIGVE